MYFRREYWQKSQIDEIYELEGTFHQSTGHRLWHLVFLTQSEREAFYFYVVLKRLYTSNVWHHPRSDYYDTLWLSHDGWSCEDFPSLLDQSPKKFLTCVALILWFYDPWLPSLPLWVPGVGCDWRCLLVAPASGPGTRAPSSDNRGAGAADRGDQRNVLTWTRGFIVISHDYLSAAWAIKVKATTWTKSINKL